MDVVICGRGGKWWFSRVTQLAAANPVRTLVPLGAVSHKLACIFLTDGQEPMASRTICCYSRWRMRRRRKGLAGTHGKHIWFTLICKGLLLHAKTVERLLAYLRYSRFTPPLVFTRGCLLLFHHSSRSFFPRSRYIFTSPRPNMTPVEKRIVGHAASRWTCHPSPPQLSRYSFL